MFQQIVRAFLAKARAAIEEEETEGSWSGAASLQFVRDFSAHFRAMGYALLRAQGYPHLPELLRILELLRRSGAIERSALIRCAEECERLLTFLESLISTLSQSSRLRDRPFNRREATETLRIYIGR